MGVKSVLSKIGKVALTAAPYVAAPFTGGASLALTGPANMAVQKWSAHDAKNAIAQGKDPSKFDSVLGKIGTVSSLASSVIPTNALGSIGMLGSAGKAASTAAKVGTAAKAGSVLSKIGTAAKIAAPAAGAIGTIAAMKNANKDQSTGLGPSSVPSSSVGNAPGFSYGSTRPNLADSISAGRGMAVKNQQFRKGYDILGQKPDVTDAEPNPKAPVLSRMPRIYSDVDRGNLYGRRRQQYAS